MARAAALVLAALLTVPGVAAQPAPSGAAPTLSRAERAALEAAVHAADAARAAAPAPAWTSHVLRTSDGAHYVAFTAPLPPDATPATGPVVLYTRLERRPADGAVPAPPARSAVAEWLAGLRATPLPSTPARMTGVQRGEMPVGGTQSMRARSDLAAIGESSAALMLMDRERQKAEARKAEEEKRHRDEMEGRGPRAPELLPFEDFDAHTVLSRGPRGVEVRRSVVAGPGDYDLIVAWADPATRAPVGHAVRQPLSLPVASATEFSLSSIVLADGVAVREVAYPPDQQASHPYSIGPTEITPAADAEFTNAERLALVVQVINATPDATGKPDVTVGFRITRSGPTGAQQVAQLDTQTYDEHTMPADFDLRHGHPLLVAVAAPMKTLPRGDYAVEVRAVDRRSRAIALGTVPFRVTATAATLLTAAPPLGPPFQRAAFLEPATLTAILDGLRPSAPSPGLQAMLDTARAGHYADLLREAPGAPEELGVRAALRGLAQFALGDSPAAAAVPVQRVIQQRAAPVPPLQALLGGIRAAGGDDRGALAAWRGALDAGFDRAALALPMAEAAVRTGAHADATAWLGSEATVTPRQARVRAAALIGSGDPGGAVTILDAHLAATPGDAPAEFLRLHALFAALAAAPAPETAGRERFKALATAYTARPDAAQAALVREWLQFVAP